MGCSTCGGRNLRKIRQYSLSLRSWDAWTTNNLPVSILLSLDKNDTDLWYKIVLTFLLDAAVLCTLENIMLYYSQIFQAQNPMVSLNQSAFFLRSTITFHSGLLLNSLVLALFEAVRRCSKSCFNLNLTRWNFQNILEEKMLGFIVFSVCSAAVWNSSSFYSKILKKRQTHM